MPTQKQSEIAISDRSRNAALASGDLIHEENRKIETIHVGKRTIPFQNESHVTTHVLK